MHGENDTIHDQNLRKYSYKKSKVEDWMSNKNGRLLHNMSVNPLEIVLDEIRA